VTPETAKASPKQTASPAALILTLPIKLLL
jgi:hypothetical protein